MSKFSRPRVFLSGLTAGIVIASIQYLFDSFIFTDRWTAVATALKPQSQGETPGILTASVFVVVMQVVGLLAGMLALRFYATRPRGAFSPTAYSWLLTYGVVSGMLVVLSRAAADPAAPPVAVPHIVAFAVCGLIACIGGASFGSWVYRQSEV